MRTITVCQRGEPLASGYRRSAMALSKPAAMDEQVCTATQALFTMRKGQQRILVEELIPEEFNRFGDPSKGSRVFEIISLLLVKPGFADYKYDCAWVVSPDPNGSFKLADQANKHAAMDELLPRRERRLYHGTFRKSHLACALLIITLGRHK